MSAPTDPSPGPTPGPEARLVPRPLKACAPDGAVVTLDLEGRVTGWGRGAEHALGYRADEVLGRPFTLFHPAEDVAAGRPDTALRAALERGRFEGEGWLLGQGGRRFWAHVVLTTLHDGDGRPVGLVQVAHDLTARGVAEALSDSLFENVPDLVARFDRELRHLSVNRRVEEATGRPSTEFVGRTNRELGLPPDLVVRWEGGLREVFATGQARTLEFAFTGPGGERHYESRLIPERGPGEEVETVLGITQDVTDRKRAERALRASEERFRRLAENAPDVIFRFEYHPRPHYTYVSPAAAALTGYAPEELCADPGLGLRLVHPEDRPRVAALMAGGLEGLVRVDVRLVHRDGHVVWTEQRAAPVFDAGGRLVAAEGIIRDVTERRRAEQALREAKEAAEQALAQVRALRGLLPICSYCKRVRDRQNYWHRLEAYIAQFTEAQVSHGICPLCVEGVMREELGGA